MLKKDEVARSTSCLNKAADDEPIFVLRANDLTAPHAVEYWAVQYRARKERECTFGLRARMKYDEAFTLAKEMREWRHATIGPDIDPTHRTRWLTLTERMPAFGQRVLISFKAAPERIEACFYDNAATWPERTDEPIDWDLSEEYLKGWFTSCGDQDEWWEPQYIGHWAPLTAPVDE